MARSEYTLINPQTKALAFNVFSFDDGKSFEEQRSYNYYSMVLVLEGTGKFKADLAEYNFASNSLMCFSNYQSFRINPDGRLRGVLINFHSDFFCIHKHQEEVACDGVLFNDAYNTPLVRLDNEAAAALLSLVDSFKREMQNPAVAQYELLLSYLKIFLIQASRIKMLGMAPEAGPDGKKEPFILRTLKDAIEEHFRTRHSPGEYADLLHITTKALNRLSKTFFNRTLTNLIAERIMIEAKRELYLTNKSIKVIAYELGFHDEFYFSRFFKNNAAISPQTYRETVGFARGAVG